MPTLKQGSSGTDVIILQRALNTYFATKYGAANTVKLTPDGDFGPNTGKAVRRFQSENNLEPDGIVGTNTWAKLDALSKSPAATPASTTPPPAASQDFSAAEKERFARMTAIVIDQLEGGYYHPAMNSVTGKLGKHNPLLDSSGETMFGIDRLNGKGDLAGPTWDKFWGMIDAAGASTAWGYNFRGGAQKDALTALAIEIMAPLFVKLSKRYLKDNWKLVAGDDRLVFHFAYATWNGAGWFRKFANDINKAIAAGKTDYNSLAQVALNSRLNEGLKEGSKPNPLIVQTGKKIEAIFKMLG